MHLHRTQLATALLLLSSLAGHSQTPAAGRPAFAPYCVQRNSDRPCPSTATSVPYLSPLPATNFASREREAGLAQSRNPSAPAPRPTLARATEAPSQYEQSPRAQPDAPDQSELLKNSKDREFILRNFKTMYISTGDIKFFDAYQMKAALGRNPDFQKLNINIVDDRRVADAVLIVSYTFAWDYPFELRHQNTTTVLLSGKGEGPFSGPLGAADVAREFVELAKPWRTVKEQKK